MRGTLGPLWLGLTSAWRTERWIEGRGLRALADGLPGDGAVAGGREEVAAEAERWAGRTLRVLARLPGRRWRATCLYRSVAACLVRRELGLPVRLALGVRPDALQPRGVAAHAWTEKDGAVDWTPLVRPSGRR